MKTLKFSRSEATQNTRDFSDKLTKFLDDVWKPWVGISGIALFGLFMFLSIFIYPKI